MMIDSERPVIELTGADRCDRCGAQAIVLAERNETELLFCAHHAREHRDKLMEVGYTLVTDGVQAEQVGYTEAVLI